VHWRPKLPLKLHLHRTDAWQKHAPLQQRVSSASLPSCSGQASNVALAGCAARTEVTSVTAFTELFPASFAWLVLNVVHSNGK